MDPCSQPFRAPQVAGGAEALENGAGITKQPRVALLLRQPKSHARSVEEPMRLVEALRRLLATRKGRTARLDPFGLAQTVGELTL